MTQPSGPHFTPDDLDLWLDGNLSEERQQHLDRCQACLELARAEREIVDQLQGLGLMSASPGFADRVMQSVVVPDPFAIRSLQTVPRRLLATRKSMAVAASVGLLLLGSMAVSIIWTLGHQTTLLALGSWLMSQGGQVAWLGLRGVASNFMEQPWFESARTVLLHPGRLALASASASVAYLGGVLALRRLLALPAQEVAHANA
jgi:anti-sigma factor RsiW